MSVTDYLNARGFHEFEGYSQEVLKQVDDLIKISSGSVLNVLEIGFNAGHSAEIFLKNNVNLTLTSFDLGEHGYVLPAKEYIDTTYPNRHTLVLGDSTVSIPKYTAENPGKTFDLIFIDGGHDYTVSKPDLDNCRMLANKDTIVIMDDTNYTDGWMHSHTIGPTRAWVEQLDAGTITEIHKVDYQGGRGMSWGKYVF